MSNSNSSPIQLSVCDGCCCGHPEKGNPLVDHADFARLLRQAGLHDAKIDFPYCLGPCQLANVVRVQIGRSLYLFSRIRSAEDRAALVSFIQNPSVLPAVLQGKLVNLGRPQ